MLFLLMVIPAVSSAAVASFPVTPSGVTSQRMRWLSVPPVTTPNPFDFSAAASINLAKMMREIGFVDVEEYALEKRGYPWVTRGRKPS